jgi:hypothetical protein
LGSSRRHDRIRASIKRFAQQDLELPHLVAAKSEAAQVLTLEDQVDTDSIPKRGGLFQRRREIS